MLEKKISIIPAIDVIGGKCVRLSQGDFDQKKIYSDNPLEVAKSFEEIGIERLHLVDLDGAQKGKTENLHILEELATHTSLRIDFGGGIHSVQSFEDVLNAGADFATIGSMAIKNKAIFTEIIQKHGAQKIILGADVRDEKIAISGWTEKTNIDLYDFITEYSSLGIEHIFITDIAKDGLLQGANFSLYGKVCKHFPKLHIIASGGVSQIKDIERLKNEGCSAVIIGKAIYELKIALTELRQFL